MINTRTDAVDSVFRRAERRGTFRATYWADNRSTCRASIATSGARIAIRQGRPNPSAIMEAIVCSDELARGEYIGIWSAGPKALNLVVNDAAYSCGMRVDFFPMAFEF